ncbi:hypothetical protein ACET3Z_013484 [Daucus carota]
MERAAEEFASQTDPDEPPPSPATCRKRNILISLRARKLNKGKIFMNPNKTVQDVLGHEEAAKWTTLSTPARIPNHAYDMMGRALNEDTQEDGTENGHDMEDDEGNENGQNMDDEAGDMDDDGGNMD